MNLSSYGNIDLGLLFLGRRLLFSLLTTLAIMNSNLVDLLTSKKTCPAISQRAFLSPAPPTPLPSPRYIHTPLRFLPIPLGSLSVQVLMTFPNGNSSGINSLKYSSFLLFYLHLYFPHFNLLRWKYFLSSEIPCLCCLI